jgi:hypothetical protein
MATSVLTPGMKPAVVDQQERVFVRGECSCGPQCGEAKQPEGATSREAARTQRAGIGSDGGRQSRLISP